MITNEFGFTDEEQTILKRLVLRTWDTIAADLYSCEEGEEEDGLYHRNDVFELSLDGDRLLAYVNKDEKEKVKELIKKVQALGWRSPKWERFVSIILPYKHYSTN